MNIKIKKFIISFIILILLLPFSYSYADSETDNLNITAGAAILIDSSTGKILYSKNENEKMYPASTTKIMTAILTLENCNLDDVVTVEYEAIASIPSGYSVAALQPGEQLTVEQLLQVMMVHSANDAANVLAYYISGSIESFATLMNTKAAELGLENTHFVNPSGAHDDNHYTTAYDLAKIMQYCMKNTVFRKLAGLKSCTIYIY
jgi:D-alanyl-D-alanine carboxypeptidase